MNEYDLGHKRQEYRNAVNAYDEACKLRGASTLIEATRTRALKLAREIREAEAKQFS